MRRMRVGRSGVPGGICEEDAEKEENSRMSMLTTCNF